MGRAFVSYSHKDSEFVLNLITELENNSNLNLIFDKKILSSGDSLVSIFGEIGESDFLIPILSKDSVTSQWCKKELSVAVIKEIDDDSFCVVPVVIEGQKWTNIKKSMSSDLRESLRDKVLCRFDQKDYDTALKDLIKSLTPTSNPLDIYSLMADPFGQNPFRRVRAEHFENPNTFVNLFTEPTAAYNELVSIKPTFIEGGRGSGKTMILRSMRAHIAPLLKNKSTFSDSNLPYFGVYFRATRDTFATIEKTDALDDNALQGIFYDELILRLAQSMVEELTRCQNNKLLSLTKLEEKLICDIFKTNIRLTSNPNSIEELQNDISELISSIIDYLRAKQRHDPISYTVKSLTKDNLLKLCVNLTQELDFLNDVCIFFLIDEYENLLENQKIVLNTLIKWHEATKFSTKIAYKKTGFSTSQTLEVQEIEDGPDYSYVNLDFELGKNKSRYEIYVKQICKNIMKKEGFNTVDISSILEVRDDYVKKHDKTPENLTNADIYEEVISLARKRKLNWSKLNPDRRLNEISHYKKASEYRLLKNRKISYGGFNDLILLSSGIVRNFIELCGMAYFYAREDNVDVKSGELISIKHQTSAIYTLSDYYLWRINKNIENFGPTIFRFVVDVGDILRQRLMHNLSEPESITLSVRDPRKLLTTSVEVVEENRVASYVLSDIINAAILHSVLQEYEKRGGRKTKNPYTGQTYDITLNRILTPSMRISPRSRWITKITSEELVDLISLNNDVAKKNMLDKVTTEDVLLTNLDEFFIGDGCD